MTGPRISWIRAIMIRRHFLKMALKSARESMKPIQIIESGVVALPTKPIASVMKTGRLRLVRKKIIPSNTAMIFGLVMMLLMSLSVILCSNSQMPYEKRAILKAIIKPQ